MLVLGAWVAGKVATDRARAAEGCSAVVARDRVAARCWAAVKSPCCPRSHGSSSDDGTNGGAASETEVDGSSAGATADRRSGRERIHEPLLVLSDTEGGSLDDNDATGSSVVLATVRHQPFSSLVAVMDALHAALITATFFMVIATAATANWVPATGPPPPPPQ